ncbi:hypothetical protein OPV22_015916 [Ensete ventricosum]|uniref:DUF7795 domain-containing protein n=1 Tax=Ensete ventricosum TaxID=4639 RepID=A0AAV8RAY8_ENSVE|nr:hypothetical protein OPV22_015916 [Ensete ventricosum]
MASSGTIAVSGANDDPVSKKKCELEKIHCELGGNMTGIFLDFMTKTAKYEELVDVGKRFLIGFHGAIEKFRSSEFQKTSENVAVTIGANWNDRMKVYVEAGYRHHQQSVQNISNLHICVLGLQDHLKKVETLLDELVCLMEDAIGVSQAANQSITALLDDTPSEEMLCLVRSFEEETKHIHLQDTSISQVIIMRVISDMLKLDCDMQKNIVGALNLKTSSPELESYCLMWDLHPYINDDVMHLAWRLVPPQDQRLCH